MAELDGRAVTTSELTALALTNYGHFTTLRVEDGHVRGLSLHLERLDRDCRALFGVELDGERVRALIRRVVPMRGTATVRVTVFDPDVDLGRPELATMPRVLVTQRAASGGPLPPLRVRSVPYERDAPGVKSVALFGTLRLRRTARQAGFDDALFTDAQGHVSEGGTWNIGFVDADSRVVWPEAACLDGVTMRLLREPGVPGAQSGVPDIRHCSEPLPLSRLGRMEAAFATNAAVGVRLVSAVDDTELRDHHPVVDALRAGYEAIPAERV